MAAFDRKRADDILDKDIEMTHSTSGTALRRCAASVLRIAALASVVAPCAAWAQSDTDQTSPFTVEMLTSCANASGILASNPYGNYPGDYAVLVRRDNGVWEELEGHGFDFLQRVSEEPLNVDPGAGHRTLINGTWYTFNSYGAGLTYPQWYDLQGVAGVAAGAQTYETNINEVTVTYPTGDYHGAQMSMNSNYAHIVFETVTTGSTSIPSRMMARVTRTNPAAQADYCLVARPGGGSSYPGATFQNAWYSLDMATLYVAFAHEGTSPTAGKYALKFPVWDMRASGGSYSGQPVWLSSEFAYSNSSSTSVTAPAGLAAKLPLNGEPWTSNGRPCNGGECPAMRAPDFHAIGAVNYLHFGNAQGSLYSGQGRWTIAKTSANCPGCVLPDNADINLTIGTTSTPDELHALDEFARLEATPVNGSNTQCNVLAGQSTCPVRLRWRVVDGYPQASVYAVDVTNATPVSALVAQSGASIGTTYPLTPGHTYRFDVLSTNNSAATPLARSQLITATGGGGGSSQVSVSATNCPIPVGQTTCSLTVTWSTTQTASTVYLYRYSDGEAAAPVQVSSGVNSGNVADALAQGTYHYELHTITTPTPANLLAASPVVTVTGGGTVGSGAGTPITSPDAASDSVGFTPGTFRVDESGGASYRIPLAVPRGAGGLAPQLAIAYSSSGQDGPLGLGWQLEGLSSIQRCRRSFESGDTLPASGVFPNVAYQNTDAFCLDGQRLLLVSGNNGAVNATYRTENDSFTRVTILAIDSSATYPSPREWIAYGKDGSIRYYGQHTVGSTTFEGRRFAAIGGQQVPASWSVVTIADTNQNLITLSYSVPKNASNAPIIGDLRLDQVAYVGGTINFTYEARPNLSIYNFGIGTLRLSQRLSEIDVNSGSALLRAYKLGYDTSPLNASVTHLDSVQECNGTVCYQPTSFSWYELPLSNGTIATQATTASGVFPSMKAWKAGDADGDGRTDIFWSDGGALRVMLSRPTSSGLAFDAGHLIPSTSMPSGFSNEAGWAVIDFDGDGKDDVLFADMNSHQWKLYRSLGNGSFAAPTAAIVTNGGTLGVDICYSDAVLADFNGDGLPDLITLSTTATNPLQCEENHPTAKMLVSVLQKKAGGGYEFALPRQLDFYNSSGGACMIGAFLQPPTESQPQAFDLNGDGLADLRLQLIDVNCHTAVLYPTGYDISTALQPDTITLVSPDVFRSVVDSESVDATESPVVYEQLFANIGVDAYGALGFRACQSCLFQAGTDIKNGDDLMVADINGDGLGDAVFRDVQQRWHFMLNGGGSVQASGAPLVAGGITTTDDQEVQLLDYDGDGHLDFWQPTGDPLNMYQVYVWAGSGFSSTPLMTQFFGRDKQSNKRVFADFDGDGVVDGVVIYPATGAWEGRRVTTHHAPRQVVTQIGNGLGAVTNIDYAPMSLSSVYIRQHDRAYAGTTWGRGSNVFDALMSRALVQYVDSSAPVYGNAQATSRVRYYYQGYKVQSGGRGSLGFRNVYSIDFPTGTLTKTTYNQGWPLTGTPATTIAQLGATGYSLDACIGDPDAVACHADAAAPAATGGIVSQSSDIWQAGDSVTVSGGISPQFVRRGSVESWKRNGINELRHSKTVYTYSAADAAHGNLSSSASYDYDAAGTIVRTTSTSNTYADTETLAQWLLGRLATSMVSVQRPGTPSITRSTAFEYDATSGLLTKEVLQPADATNQLKLTTHHAYDGYGNEIQKTTCSGQVPDATCKATTSATLAANFSPTDSLRVQRYVRSTYPDGRFASSQFVPVDSTATGVNEVAASTVSDRDPFGNPKTATDANGLVVTATYGSFGRLYATTAGTGTTTTTKYLWCAAVVSGGVACPLGASYRIEQLVSGAPTSWTYYDVLGRDVLSFTQGFGANEFRAVAKAYDSRGNPTRVSEPYFAEGPFASGMAPETPKAGEGRYYTITTFDSLGRPSLSSNQATGATLTYGYSNLATTVTSSANGSGEVQIHSVERNALGEDVTVSEGQATDADKTTLSFTYDASGNVLTASRTGLATDGVSRTYVTTMTYDVLGRKTSLDDPDAGRWSYAYNAAGEQVRAVSLSLQRPTCTQSNYDARGRLFLRDDYAGGTVAGCSGAIDAHTRWAFDSVANGYGQLGDATTTLNGQALEKRTPTYDAFGRLTNMKTVVGSGTGAGTYQSTQDFDLYGRLWHTHFWGSVNGTAIAKTSEEYGYSATGYQETVSNYTGNVTGSTYSDVQAINRRGQVQTVNFAGSSTLSTTRTYDVAGRLLNIASTPGNLQQLTYTYDGLGNVTSREDASTGSFVHEVFGYDNRQRLKQVQRWTSQTDPTLLPQLGHTYDSFGNIATKAETALASYTYGSSNPLCNAAQEAERVPGPGAVTLLNGNQYCYDAHGNQVRMMDPANPTGPQKRWLTYYNFDLPSAAYENNSWSQHATVFRYGADRQRLQRVDYNAPNISGAAASQATYVGNAEIIQHFDTGVVEIKKYLPGVMLQISSGGVISPRYLFTDALGSTHRITTGGGTIVGGGKQAWTAFGRRADLATGAPLQAVDANGTFHFDTSATHHGYTGHEQLDEEGLVHMNGRVYDSSTGRFLQADPFVQSPGDPQSYNRYSYVLNNPLAHTDPTGYLTWSGDEKYWGQAVWIVAEVGLMASAGSYASLATTSTSQGALAIGAAGFTVGAMQTMSLKGAVIGAFEAEVNFAIGNYFAGDNAWSGTSFAGYEREGKIFAHATLGGITEYMRGGKFGQGFVSAGVGEALAPGLSKLPPTAGIVAEATIGGTLSELVGGKFANGAVASAFAFAFNECSHNGCWVTDEERSLAEAGRYKEYYAAGGRTDPYLRRAGEVATLSGGGEFTYMLTLATNYNLATSILSRLPADAPASTKLTALAFNLEGIRADLARAHVAALDSRGASPTHPVRLRRDDIATFHDVVFDRWGAGPVFGGRKWDQLGPVGRAVYDWCPAPSCQ